MTIKKSKILYILIFIFSLTIIATNVLAEKNAVPVSTLEPSNITDTTVKLRGSVIANTDFPVGSVANSYFRYSAKFDFPPVFCNDIYGSEMYATNEVRVTLGNNGYQVFTTDVSDLEQNTTYYYCAVASNKNLISYGEVKKFTTGISSGSEVSSSVETRNPLVINGTSVYLNGFYNTSTQAETWFEYRQISQNSKALGTQFKMTGWSAKKNPQNHNANTNGNINYLLAGLTPNTSYEYRAAIKSNTENNTTYGNIFTFKTLISGETYNDNSIQPSNTNTSNLQLGDTATPPIDAIVRYKEGIEHVFTRQIMNDSEIAKTYGYTEGMNLQSFAWNLSDLFARIFGYVDESGKEIRVSMPDIAAYLLKMNKGDLTVYEYYSGVIVNIQKMTEILRNVYDYEYYFRKN